MYPVSNCPLSKSESTSFTDKKSKRKKERPADQISDDISDCLAKLSLQSSSAPHPQMPHPAISKTDEPVGNHPVTPAPRAPSASMASPSDSTVINALHLSNIDWDALSFTSSPPAQSAAEAKPIAEMQKTSGRVEEADSSCAAQSCYMEHSLRDRLLLKNMAKAADQTEGCKAMVSKHPNTYIPSSCPNLDTHKDIPTNLNRIEHLSDQINYTSNGQLSDAPRVKHRVRPAAQPSSKTTNNSSGSQKPPQKYKFVKKAVSSGAQCCSDPNLSWKNPAIPRIKSSVCTSVASSSEESDTENQQCRPQGKTRIKPMDKIKANFRSDMALKPISGSKLPSKSVSPVQLSRQKPQSCSLEVRRNIKPLWDQDKSPAKVNSDAFLQNPASPVVTSDSDDSVVCSESPLPLAERLRLKFLK